MRTTIVLACCLAVLASGARAQGTDTTGRADTLTADDAAAAAYLYDQPAALRATAPLDIPAGHLVDGNVAVLEAPLTVAGHVTGRVTVINGDVTVAPGGRIDGDLTVTGGVVRAADSAAVGGRVRAFRERMSYRVVDDEIVAATSDTGGSLAAWFRRWKRRHRRSQSRLMLRGGTYNRVEGLPVLAGVALRRNADFGPTSVEALGIWRSADHFEWKGENLGYRISGEMQFGFGRGIAIGAQAFDEVQPLEPWQLRDSEIGLATFFFHRDYRDYYNRHGARGYVSLRDGRTLSLTLGYGVERWQPRRARDPFTLFHNGAPWRPNPVMDAGRFRLADATLTYDTRNNEENPWTGWLITARVEHGWSPQVVEGPTAPLARPAATGPVRVAYSTGMIDARRYNRVSPEAQLNARLVLGGWLGGDPLPLERRFSLGGAGTLPGYDFREPLEGTDVFTCSDAQVISGIPAQCERMLLAQLEYRHDIHLHLFERADAWTFHHPLQWVVFTDAGRGWLLHEYAADGTVRRRSDLPPLGTLKADVGVGFDADVIGLFVAKSVTDASNRPNFLIRLRHRF